MSSKLPTRRLGDTDVAEIILGQSPPSSAYNDNKDGLPFFQGKADFGLLHPTPRTWCNAGQKFARAGDVLMSVRAPVGDVNFATDDCVIGRGVAAIRAGAKTDPWFLYFALLYSKPILEDRATGSTFASINKTTLNDLAIPFADPSEQAPIGAILRQLVKKTEQEARAGYAATELKHAAMRKLFTCGLHGEAQRETEIGMVPESWEIEQLGNIAHIAYGAQAAVANATDPSIGTLILTNVNLDLEGHINLEKRRYYKIPESHADRLSLREGDVLFNWRSGSSDHVGKSVYFDLDGEFTYSSFILRFRPHRSVTGKFLFRWLTHLRVNGFFTSQRNVSSINSVFNASLSATIPIWFPHWKEQEEIITILDALDRKIDLHQRKRGVLQELFKSLLHKLMTGEIAVSDLDLSVLPSASTQPKKATA